MPAGEESCEGGGERGLGLGKQPEHLEREIAKAGTLERGASSPKPTSESTYLPPDMLARGWLQALRRFPWAVI